VKKGITLTILIIFLVFISFKTAHASFGSVFGGTIIAKPAIEISTLESSNFNCEAGLAGGTSISIIPIGSPAGTSVSYYIPAFIAPVTGLWHNHETGLYSYYLLPGTSDLYKTVSTIGQLILGMYDGKIPIACVYQGYPPVVVTVPLSIITYFGTSIR
jgi:hypothetical protein